MTIAERLGWTAGDLRARRALARTSAHSPFDASPRKAKARRVERAQIVFCAAAIARQLKETRPTKEPGDV